jgi:hypothetical protein
MYLKQLSRGIPITVIVNETQRNEVIPSCTKRRLLQPSSNQHCRYQYIERIYPDTLRYRDSFDLPISMHFAFEIGVSRNELPPGKLSGH